MKKLFGFFFVVLSVITFFLTEGWGLLLPATLFLVGFFLSASAIEHAKYVVEDMVNDALPEDANYVITSVFSLLILIAVIIAVAVVFVKLFS